MKSEEDLDRETRQLDDFGKWGTAGILIFVVAIKFRQLDELFCMSLNEFGDFLAGAVGPIALLWLILGYRQQRIELMQNRRSIDLQIQELQNTVEQQSVIAKATMQMLDIESSRFKTELEPSVALASITENRFGENRYNLEVSIANLGATVFNLNVTFTPTPDEWTETIPELKKGPNCLLHASYTSRDPIPEVVVVLKSNSTLVSKLYLRRLPNAMWVEYTPTNAT